MPASPPPRDHLVLTLHWYFHSARGIGESGPNRTVVLYVGTFPTLPPGVVQTCTRFAAYLAGLQQGWQITADWDNRVVQGNFATLATLAREQTAKHWDVFSTTAYAFPDAPNLAAAATSPAGIPLPELLAALGWPSAEEE